MSQQSEEPWEFVIPEAVMEQIREMPPEMVDRVAEAISELRANPAMARPLVPHAVDYRDPARRAALPSPRTRLRLRAAVAQISPETVENFDTEWAQDTAGSGDERMGAARAFMARWLLYVAVQGDATRARAWAQAERQANPEDTCRVFSELMAQGNVVAFPMAGDDGDLAASAEEVGAGQWLAVDPVTEMTGTGSTEREAVAALRGALEDLLFPGG